MGGAKSDDSLFSPAFQFFGDRAYGKIQSESELRLKALAFICIHLGG